MIDLHRFSLIFTDVLMISMFHLIFIQFQHFYINFQLFIFVCHRFVTEFHRLSDDFHLFALMWIIYDLSYVFHVSSILIVFQVVVDVELLLSIVIGYYQISLTVMDFNRFFYDLRKIFIDYSSGVIVFVIRLLYLASNYILFSCGAAPGRPLAHSPAQNQTLSFWARASQLPISLIFVYLDRFHFFLIFIDVTMIFNQFSCISI